MEAAPSVAAAASGGGDIEAARVLLCGLLQKYSATKAMPSSGKVVVLDTELSVRHAFWAIYDNGLNCAVAWDAKRRAYVGMLTYSDFMDVLRFLYRTAHADGVGAHGPAAVAAAIATGLDEHQVQSWQAMPAAGRSTPEGLVSVRPDASMMDCVHILQSQQIHRAAMIDPANNAVLCTVTYWRMLRYLARKMRKKREFDSLLACTIAHLGLASRPPITVRTDATVISVLDLLSEHRISSIPVVDAEGKLVNVYARTDVQYMALTQSYDMDVTVTEALQHKVVPVYRCRADTDTLGVVLDVMASSSVRRLVCVDEAGVVRGIVSLSDVFRLITGGREVPQPEPEPFA
jgi:5'-AMP-activated protein kinase regulatory gamma subunit|eukprot:COSAG04_NODE_1034_length_8611_cov_4.315672_2_plen_346_part_00